MSNTTAFLDGRICVNTYNDTNNITDPTELSLFCLSRGQSVGLTLIAEAGVASMLAITYVFGIIFRTIIRSSRLQQGQRSKLLVAPIDILMLSLFVADFLQGIGAALDIKWINEGKVEAGGFCTAQGVIQQLGETGVAITTLMITIYTFMGIWWRIGHGRKGMLVAKVVVAGLWIFIILITVLGNVKAKHKDDPPFVIPTPYWCWINQHYLVLRLFGEYLWIWIALFVSLLCYMLIYLWSRDIITREENDPWWKFHVSRKTPESNPTKKSMPSVLAYPFVYCALVLPLSLVRWIQFPRDGTPQNPLPSAAALAADTIFCLSGVANVILFLVTRPKIALFGKGDTNHEHYWDTTTQQNGLPDGMSRVQSKTEEVHLEIIQQPREDPYTLGRLPSL